MKNIFDIINEQKSYVDLDIARYDLEYTINQFDNNDYYMQEGLGETIQNVGRKVIEFIKKIISKIRELVRAVINVFRKNNDPIKKMEAQISDANKNSEDPQPSGGGGGGGSNAEAKKTPQEQMEELNKKNQERREAEIKEMERKRREKEERQQKEHDDFVKDINQPFKTGAGVKIDSLKELLANSNYRFSYYSMRGSLSKRLSFVKNFAQVFNMTYSHSESLLKRRGERIMQIDSSYLVNKMNSALFGEEDLDLHEALADVLDDFSVANGGTANQAFTFEYVDHIYEYIQGGRDFADIVERLGKNTEDVLKKIINSLEKHEKIGNMQDDLSDKHFTKLSVIFQRFSNYTAKTIDYLLTTTMSEYRSCVEIAQTVTTQYCKMMR